MPPALAPLLALALSALPPAPEKVVLVTRTFGSVTVDHSAHLKRRAHCSSCHGPGPVTKLGRLPPREAHERCIGCHRETGRGPTGCRQCHVLPEPAAAPAAAAAPAPAPPGDPAPRPPASPGGAPVALAKAAGPAAASAIAATPAPSGMPARPAIPPAPVSPALVPEPPDGGGAGILLELGASTLSSSHRPRVMGPALRVTLREDGLLIRQSLEWSGGQSGRTLGLLGCGWSFPLHRRWSLEALALAGFDATSGQPVDILPAASLQVGVAWFARLGFVETVGLSVTGLSDLVRRRSALGEPIGGTALSAMLTVGIARGPGP
jgi:hypothetical protein